MFANLLKSNFGDSAPLLASPLEPRLKNGQDVATAQPAPDTFETRVGQRRVPRQRDPKHPSYDMIKEARKGILSGFLRLGKIFRASDLVGEVNPYTAIITLHEIYEFESRCLAAIDSKPTPQLPLSSVVPFKKVADKGAEDGKNLRNLFFIALAHDELPSFHFWTNPGDVDPVTAGEPVDWGRVFDKNPPSPATTAKITMLENQRKEQAQRSAEPKTQDSPSLGFLDNYNVTNSPDFARELTQGQPADDGSLIRQTLSAPVVTEFPTEAEVLLQFNRGGMYLREFTHKALHNMACWLVENEEDDDEAQNAPIKIDEMFLDILEPGEDPREERIVSVSPASTRTFQDKIVPSFGRPDNKFRIRSANFPSWWNLETSYDSGSAADRKYDLRLVRPNVGYCYCSGNWDNNGLLHSNNKRFEKVLQFLFDWKLSAYPRSNHLSLDIPGHGSFSLYRDSDMLLNANIQEIFAELSKTQAGTDYRPIELFIRDVPEDITDGSEFLGLDSPMLRNANHKAGIKEVPGKLQATKIGEGADTPSIHPRLLTNPEVTKLQERLRLAEASIVETDDLQERLKISENKLAGMSGLQRRLKASEDRAKLKSSCPFCSQDWAGVTKQQQQDHLKLHQKDIVHQPAAQNCPHPGCASCLGEDQHDATYEAIAQHFQFHIEEEHAKDGICDHPRCHANMYALTGEQQEEHESNHYDNEELEKKNNRLQEKVTSLEKAVKKLERSQKEARDLEDIVKERDKLQEQVRNLEDALTKSEPFQQQTIQQAASERNQREEAFIQIASERDKLKERVVELERQLHVPSSADKGMQRKSPEPETEMEAEEDPGSSSHPKDRKRLRYCNICLKSVDKLSNNAKSKHADKCETNMSEFLLITAAGAKAERQRMDARGSNVKEKLPAKAAASNSLRPGADDTSTIQQPETSKATGRKPVKRKLDIFKPSKEDETDEEEVDSPRKKPKLKAKAAKAHEKEAEPTRRSARHKETDQPPELEVNEDKGGDGGDNEPSSSAKGGRGKKKAKTKR